MNALDSLLLQRRLLWKLAYNKDRIAQSVQWLSKDCTAGESGFYCWQKQYTFQLSKAFLWILCPTQPHIQNVIGLLSRWPNGAGFQADLSPRSSVNFSNEWKYTYTPHTHVHGVIPDRYRGIFHNLLLHKINLDYKSQRWKKFVTEYRSGFYR